MCKFTQLVVVFALVLSVMLGCKGDNAATIAPDAATPSANRPAAPGNAASNAAVIYSSWANIPNWSALTNAANYIYYQYTFSGLTRLNQDILAQGTILAYVRFEGSTEVYPMPFKRAWDRVPGRLFYENWSVRINLNQLTAVIDPESNGYNPPANAQFRYVLIPGDTPGGRKAAVDYNNYEEVRKAFNIPE